MTTATNSEAPGPTNPSTPGHHLLDITGMGRLAALLAGDAASALTGNIARVDSGHCIGA